MKEIKIITKTELGEQALNKNLKEYKKMPLHQKISLNGLVGRSVSKDPLTLTLTIKNNFLAKQLDEKVFVDGLRKSMNEEGVKEQKDYEVIIFE